MTFRPDSERHGYLKVLTHSGGSYLVRLNEYEQLTEAFRAYRQEKRPDPLYEAEDLQGDTIAIDLEDVCGVWRVSARGLERYDADEAERKLHNLNHGED